MFREVLLMLEESGIKPLRIMFKKEKIKLSFDTYIQVSSIEGTATVMINMGTGFWVFPTRKYLSKLGEDLLTLGF
jgi:hypothetical protein